MIGSNHENDLIGLLETLKDATESQLVMNYDYYHFFHVEAHVDDNTEPLRTQSHPTTPLVLYNH